MRGNGKATFEGFPDPPPIKSGTMMSNEERRAGPNLQEIFSRLGVDIHDPASVREFAEDHYYLRRLREKNETRQNMTWTAAVTAVASAIVGALGVLLNSYIHTGKTP